VSRSLRRGAIAAIVLAAIVPLSACSAGNTPDTLEIKPDNAATSIGTDLRLNNIVVVTPSTSAIGGGEYAGPATITVNISNTGIAPETLKALTVGEATATFTDEKGAALPEIVIPANGAVLLGGEGAPVARVADARLVVGGFVPTAFTFGRVGSVSAQANVQPAVGYYASYGPKAAAVPTAKPSASTAASAPASVAPSGSAVPSSTASGAATPSGSASPSSH